MVEDSRKLKSLRAAIVNDAPRLAALLDGAEAEIAVRALGRSLLNDAEATIDEVSNAAQRGDRLKILAAEQEAQLRARQGGESSLTAIVDAAESAVREASAGLADTQDARRRQVETHDWTNMVLAFGVTIGFFVLLFVLLFGGGVGVNGGLRDLLFTLLGVVATGWANIIGFYFGTSAGSAQKSQAINDALLRATAK
ncbi:MAG TPA: hypothetical protein VFB15_10545 [Candidatus Binataceae bacterium]|jgi:hypothetical protein|nr:hypothetical protein [Candidatus Binataceae bacterium]